MNTLLLQHSPCIHDRILELTKSYPQSSVLRYGGGEFPKSPPPLTDKWIVVINLNGHSIDKVLKQAIGIEDMCHFIFVSGNGSGKPQELLNSAGFKFQTISNLKHSTDFLVKYIKGEVQISEVCAKQIISLSNRYEPNIIRNLKTLRLATNTVLTQSIIDKYLAGSNVKSLYQLYNYTLLRKGFYTDMVQVINHYQDNILMVNRFIIKQLERDICMFKDILNGELSLENYIDYATKNNMSIPAVQGTLLLFNNITIEALYARLYLHRRLDGCSAADFVMKALRN